MFFRKATPIQTSEEKIDQLLSRGVDEVLPSKEALKALLMSGKRLRIKLGIDPTGSRLHLGHTAPLLKLRDFQELGHTIVFIVGDFTAVIGDTSDKDAERPMLSDAEIKKNMEGWRQQVGRSIDLSRALFKHNSTWLSRLTYREIGVHADAFSVSDFIARDNIKRRLDQGKRVSLREVLYPLMQGYDSVAVHADVEIGGSDQRFNLLAGRTLQEKHSQKPQHVLTLSLLTDAAGKKISKTGGATIYLTDEPKDMFGKAMAIPDELVRPYCISMTRLPLHEVDRVVAGHPKEAKLFLATELVRMYHGAEAARVARENFDRSFTRGDVPENTDEVRVGEEGLMEALVAQKLIESKSEYRRLISAGAIRIAGTDEKLTERSLPPYGQVLRIGKHRFVKIIK